MSFMDVIVKISNLTFDLDLDEAKNIILSHTHDPEAKDIIDDTFSNSRTTKDHILSLIENTQVKNYLEQKFLDLKEKYSHFERKCQIEKEKVSKQRYINSTFLRSFYSKKDLLEMNEIQKNGLYVISVMDLFPLRHSLKPIINILESYKEKDDRIFQLIANAQALDIIIKRKPFNLYDDNIIRVDTTIADIKELLWIICGRF